MKIYRRLALSFLALALAFLTGCATNRPLVSTWRNPQFTLSPTNTIALTIRPNQNLEDAESERMVTVALERSGFALVPALKADYFLTYVFSENTEEHVWKELQPVDPMMTMMPGMSLTPQTTSQIIARPIIPQPSVPVFRTQEYRTKDIRLFLYPNPKNVASGLQLAWLGTIAVGKSASPEREFAMLKTLLIYLGKDFNGRVELVH